MTSNEMPADVGTTLLSLARRAIAQELGRTSAEPTRSSDAWLQQLGACFVTLTQQGALRGCIGSLQAYRTLESDVRANALAAAFRDPRFLPLSPTELEHTRLEVSLLSAMEPLTFSSETDALAQLRPGVDGVVFEYGANRSTFLPQVWEQLPRPEEFMAHLKRKAGLDAHFWQPEVCLSRYTVAKWKEPERHAVAAKGTDGEPTP